MKHDAAYWIRRRKEIWEERHDIAYDKRLRSALAKEMMTNKEFRIEVKKNPEYLIELEFVIVDKNKQVVPFFLNDVQKEFLVMLNQAKKDFEEGKILNLTFLILKGRQQGFTSFITAYQLACSVLKKNFEGYTLADAVSNAQTIFENKAKFPHRNLPPEIQPVEKLNNRKEMRFINMNSSWEVGVASKDVGRSRTINFFHGSEAAFWKVPMSDLQAAMDPALAPGCISIYETTANGFNDFKDMWDSGVHINCFFEWWKTSEYQANFESEDKEQAFAELMDTESSWIAGRLRWLRDSIGLKPEQLYWYYRKWEVYVDKEKIRQEYPCTPEEAFLMSGRPVFNVENVVKRIDELKRLYKKNPYLEGYFAFEWEDPETENKIVDSTIRFIPDPNKNWIRLYRQPEEKLPYVLGGDTKGEGRDFFSGTMVDNTTGRRVATLHMQTNTAKPYTHQMYCMGRYFNDALIGIEINFNTGPIEELARLRYPNQYVRRKYDDYTKKAETKYGWKTDGNTRPVIIDRYGDLINENIDLIYDIPTLQEAMTFIYDDNGRADAMDGKHDDLLFSDMIANQIREQQSYEAAKDGQRRSRYTEDMLEDWRRAGSEERKLMVELWGSPD